jgi:hypothetical protein
VHLMSWQTFAYPGSVAPRSWNWPNPGPDDSFIRRGRYPDFKGPLPFTRSYELAGVVEKAGSGVAAPREGQIVADLWHPRLQS